MTVRSLGNEAVMAELIPSCRAGSTRRPARAGSTGRTGSAGSTDVTPDAPAADAVAAGTLVMLLDQHEGGPVSARVESWSAADGGMVISTRLVLDASDAERLADRRVWVSVTSDGPGYSVFGGIARSAGRNTLDVTGIAPLVQEARRGTPRAEHRATVSVTVRGMQPSDLRAVDLSRGGVRVSMEGRAGLTAGAHVLVEMSLEGGSPVHAEGEVSRVDTLTGQAVVRFQNLDAAASTRLDRFLLRRMTRAS